MFIKIVRLFVTAFILIFSSEISCSIASAQTVTRLTFNQSTDIAPSWDPRGVNIAYSRLKDGTTSVYEAYQVFSSGQGGEQPLLTGLNADFGVAVQLSWFGSSGFLAVEEAISGFEIFRFNTALAPFDRKVANGADAANELLLSIDGGGGGSLTRISRDGNTALIRFSSTGGGGIISIRSGPVANMTGASSQFGTVLYTVNAGGDPRFINGGALNPDGSKFALSFPKETSTTGHDIVIGDTVANAPRTNLTNSDTRIFNINPDFSPDGTKIAFARWSGDANETYDLYVMNIDGTGVTQLTNTPFFTEINPSWSPDGTSIAFTGTHVAGHETEFPALETGEPRNANIYILTLPATNIVTSKTVLTDPPIVSVNDETREVTFTLAPFLKAQKPVKASPARSKNSSAEKKGGAKYTFKYELEITKDGGTKKKDRIRKISKRNQITVKNLEAGDYHARYRVNIKKKKNKNSDDDDSGGGKESHTSYSPSSSFNLS